MLSIQDCQQARKSRDPRFDGLFFVMVKTTKIFCRNICRVRMPLEKNVEYCASAQQALTAGYRPCLRCRPDSAPMSSAWQGVNTTVNRALKLLGERMDQSIESIAESLGISARYLNVLLQTHIHMSAKRYRIYQQVLMAKNLLQQTTLSIEQVAHSVGYSSARQLQHHIKEQLRLTPSQLRNTSCINGKNKHMKIASKIESTNIPLSQNVQISLAYRPPYNWPQVRDFFARRVIIDNETVHEQGLTKILSIDECAVPVNIIHLPNSNEFSLAFNAAFSQYTLRIIAIVKRMLDLDADPQLIKQALLKAGLKENELVEGIRIPGVASEFEAGCRAILGQQVSVTAAVNKVNQLHQYFSSGGSNIPFPAPFQLAQNDLLFLKMPAKRRQTLIDFAQAYCLIDADKSKQTVAQASAAKPPTLSGDDHVKQLLEIKGIGPWTVNYVQLRALGNSDIWLESDLVIKQQVAKLQAKERHLQADLAAPWRSYLSLNLWSLAS